MISELAIASYLSMANPYSVPVADHRLRVAITGKAETPLPEGLAPTSLLDVGTGALTVTPDAGDLVSSANRYLRALAVLPVNPDDDALVDRIVEARVGGTAKKRRLPRR